MTLRFGHRSLHCCGGGAMPARTVGLVVALPVRSRPRRTVRWMSAGLAGVLVASLLWAPPVSANPGGALAAPSKPACPASRPDEVSAMVAARLCGGDVQVDRDATESSQVWAQANGQLRLQTFAG